MVASFTDAWIETYDVFYDNNHQRVASFTDAWIETQTTHTLQSKALLSHLLQMRGLKPFEPNTILTHFGRIFYRCVD